MRLRRFIVVAAIVAAGCGGGGSVDLGGSPGGTGGTSAVGPLIVTAKTGGQPAVYTGGNGSTNLYVASGASFTSVITNLPKTLDNTSIEMSIIGEVDTAAFSSSGQLVPTELTAVLPIAALGTPASINALGRIAFAREVNNSNFK